MRSLLGRQRKQADDGLYASVLDLGGSAVKALVIERSGDQITIRGRGRAESVGAISEGGEPGDLGALVNACERALRAAEDSTVKESGPGIVPDEVLVSVPTAWLRGSVGWHSVERHAVEATIDAEECREPVVHAGRHALRNLGRATGAGKWELVDATLVTFSVDGRPVTEPVGLRGHLLEATCMVTAAPRTLLDTLRQISDMLKLEPPHLVAEPFALAAASPSDALLIEVGAQSTGLILTRCAAPVAFGGIHLGGAALTKALASTFSIPLSRAEALKRAYSGGELSDDGMQAFHSALVRPLALWWSAVSEQLRSWKHVRRAWTPDILLCGGVGELPDVLALLSAARWMDILPFPRTPHVRLWDGSTVAQVVDRTGTRWQQSNVVALSLAAWVLRDSGVLAADGVLRASLGIGSQV